MNKFAKLFESEKFGQIVAMRGTDDEGCPAVVFYTEPPGFGVCKVALGFPDTEEGYDKRDAAFSKVTKEDAEKMAGGVFSAVENSSHD